MRKQQKDCLEGDCKEIDAQNDRNNQQQVRSVSSQISKEYTHYILLVSTRNPPRTHQGMF